jgi:hypothetical protein
VACSLLGRPSPSNHQSGGEAEEITLRSAERGADLEMIQATQQYQPAKPFAHPGTSTAIFRDES